jgi:outer membrane protein TolC
MQRRIILLFLTLASGPLSAEHLSEDDFLTQVRVGNHAFRAAEATDAALELGKLEPETMLSPRLDAQLSYLDDKSLQNSPFSSTDYSSTTWSAVLSKEIDGTGTQLSLGYQGQSDSTAYPSYLASLFGSFGGFNNPLYYYNIGYYVSIQQPLWKDFGARGYEAQQAFTNANMGSLQAMNRQEAASLLFQAQSTYLQLSADREIMVVLQDSLSRSQKILDLTQQKLQDNLVDKVDELEADAALKQVQLGIDDTTQRLHQDEAAFNALRGLSPDAEVQEDLDPVDLPSGLPAMSQERLDVQAARQDSNKDAAYAEQVRERYRPDLSLFGTATTSGQASDFGDAADPQHPTYLVGVKLDTILDVNLYNKVVEGADKSVNLSRDTIRQKELSQAQDWQSLKTEWETLQDSLQLAQALEDVQKEKAEREETRYENGQTTNFQVLRFQEDYDQARISTMRFKVQAAVLAAQANFYNGGGVTW